jgi:two-component system LytT family response regulator
MARSSTTARDAVTTASASPALVRAVVVEDEAHARQSLREYAQGVDWLALVGEAGDGVEAVRLIDEARPDLVFLDVCLTEITGLDVLARLRHRPEVVFTTAHDRFAMAAFELGALDYLLKPFGRQRFQTMLERVRRRMTGEPLRGGGQSAARAPAAASAVDRARSAFGSPLKRLFARTREGIVPIDVKTIEHLQASGDYVEVFSTAGRYLLHASLAELTARLDPETFRQVHRSHVVNLEAIELLTAFDARRLLVQLRGGQKIVASRAASEALRDLAR